MVYTIIPHESPRSPIHLGTAGWNLRREHAHRFSTVGTHLQRYASLFNAVEINSCFYRPHRLATYERWAASVPADFRFSVKLPKAITHQSKLVDIASTLHQFLAQIAGLGPKLGPILVQLPPSLAFDPVVARSFFETLRDSFAGDVVLEPRHPTWFTSEVEGMLIGARIARVAADPAPVPAAAEPGGSDHLVYLRLHGSPRIYYSAYPPEELSRVAGILEARAARGICAWCIFDNTALGAATLDAFTVRSQLCKRSEHTNDG